MQQREGWLMLVVKGVARKLELQQFHLVAFTAMDMAILTEE